MTADLAAWLLAPDGPIAEDERAAREAPPAPWTYGTVDSVAGGSLYDATRIIASVDYDVEPTDQTIRRDITEQQADDLGAYLVRWDPARVLAECAAKRAVVEAARDALAEVTGVHLCPNPIEVTRLDRVGPEHICGCGYRPPPTCVCGDRGTHRPEPGIGCTRPGCLCLEPAEPRQPYRPGGVVRPGNPGRRVRM